MDWVFDVLTSEFFWGVAFGMLLGVFVVVISNWLSKKNQKKIVAALCQDLISSICDLIQNLEDNRNRNRIIDGEFLQTISAEIIVYSRNREHLVHVNDKKLREDIREFFTRVAALLAQIQGHLRQFSDSYTLAQSEANAEQKKIKNDIAQSHLDKAHSACDLLRELISRRETLEKRIETFSKKLF